MSFINLTNHPSINWDEKQIVAAETYGKIIDMQFPAIEAEADEESIQKLAIETVNKVLDMKPTAVLCQGEFTLVYAVVNLLKEHDIPVMAACSKRETIEEHTPDGTVKKALFKFVRFREYK